MSKLNTLVGKKFTGKIPGFGPTVYSGRIVDRVAGNAYFVKAFSTSEGPLQKPLETVVEAARMVGWVLESSEAVNER